MITARRLLLVFLLTLLMVSFVGHLINVASGMQHIQSESTCALHQAINVPANLPSSWNEAGIPPEPSPDDTCLLDLILPISHPPTF